MTLQRSVASAVGDSALSSVATFAVGLYAARELTLAEIGGYGILFVAAFVLGSSTITQLYFTPVELALVEQLPARQLATVHRSAAVGLGFASTIGVVVIVGGTLLVPGLAWSARLQLGVGAAAVASLSPTQDHVRRVLHQAGRSARAMQVSTVQLLVAVAVVVGLSHAGAPPVTIPFTALAAANGGSLLVGLLLARVDGDRQPAHAPPARNALRLGAWLVLSTQADQLAAFVAVAVLGALAGARAVGEYEVARQLAQPLFVLSAALQAVLRPRVIRAAQRADRPSATRYTVIYSALLVAAGVLYAAVAGVRWPGNPLVHWFPNAFAREWMLASLVLVTACAFVTPMLGIQAVAARREKDLVRISLTTSLVYIGAVAALAHASGSLAMPAASLLYIVFWLVRFRPVLRHVYRRARADQRSGPFSHALSLGTSISHTD